MVNVSTQTPYSFLKVDVRRTSAPLKSYFRLALGILVYSPSIPSKWHWIYLPLTDIHSLFFSTTLTVDDKNILLSQGGNAAAADGAGITIDGASASMLYTAATNSFNFNRGIRSTDSSVLGGDGSSTGVKIDDGSVVIRTGTGSVAYIDLYCEVSNAHRVRLQSPAHSQYSGNITVKLPNEAGTVATVGTDSADILTIKNAAGSTVKTIRGAGNSSL